MKEKSCICCFFSYVVLKWLLYVFARLWSLLCLCFGGRSPQFHMKKKIAHINLVICIQTLNKKLCLLIYFVVGRLSLNF